MNTPTLSTKPALLFCERGPAALVIELGDGADRDHEFNHCALWTGSSVISATAGYGVVEESLSSFLQSGPINLVAVYPPSGVDLEPAISFARACVGQKYDMKQNAWDAISWLLEKAHLAGRFSASVLSRLRVKMTFQPPKPTDTPAKNCVALLVYALQNCPTISGREYFWAGWTPPRFDITVEDAGWKRE